MVSGKRYIVRKGEPFQEIVYDGPIVKKDDQGYILEGKDATMTYPASHYADLEKAADPENPDDP